MKNRRKTPTIYSHAIKMNTALQEPANGIKFMIFVLILAVVLVGLVWQKILILETLKEIDDLEKQRQALEEKIGKLNSEVLQLSNNERLIEIGKNKLNLDRQPVTALEGEIIYNEDDFVIPMSGKNE